MPNGDFYVKVVGKALILILAAVGETSNRIVRKFLRFSAELTAHSTASPE